MTKTVSILLYDDVEVLDFAGPLDVFLLANEHGDKKLFEVQTVAKKKKPIIAAYNFCDYIGERAVFHAFLELASLGLIRLRTS